MNNSLQNFSHNGSDHLPSVEDLPILPDMLKTMDVDLAVSEDGKVYIFHEKPLIEALDFIEYDLDDASLHFVGINGRMQNIGMKVQAPMKKYMEKSNNVYLIHVGGDKADTMQIIDLVMIIRNAGL